MRGRQVVGNLWCNASAVRCPPVPPAPLPFHSPTQRQQCSNNGQGAFRPVGSGERNRRKTQGMGTRLSMPERETNGTQAVVKSAGCGNKRTAEPSNKWPGGGMHQYRHGSGRMFKLGTVHTHPAMKRVNQPVGKVTTTSEITTQSGNGQSDRQVCRWCGKPAAECVRWEFRTRGTFVLNVPLVRRWRVYKPARGGVCGGRWCVAGRVVCGVALWASAHRNQRSTHRCQSVRHRSAT